MTNARQVVKVSVTVNNSPIKGYVHLDDHDQPTYKVWVIKSKEPNTHWW